MTFTIVGLLMVIGNPNPIEAIENKAETLELCMSGVKAILELPVKDPQYIRAFCAVRFAGEKT